MTKTARPWHLSTGVVDNPQSYPQGVVDNFHRTSGGFCPKRWPPTTIYGGYKKLSTLSTSLLLPLNKG